MVSCRTQLVGMSERRLQTKPVNTEDQFWGGLSNDMIIGTMSVGNKLELSCRWMVMLYKVNIKLLWNKFGGKITNDA